MVKGIKTRRAIGLTYNYAAPELLQRLNDRVRKTRSDIDKKIDVFAFAMTMYEVATLKCPWEGLGLPEIEKEVLIGRRPIVPAWIMANPKIMAELGPFLELLRKCWDSSPLLRPSFQTVLEVIAREQTRLRGSSSK